MPTSHDQQLNEIIDLIQWTNPYKILDIGVGFGKYGFLSREYLELWDNEENYDPKKWKRKIDGIEVFEKYITPIHNFVYNKIFIGNAKDILPKLTEKYDLILLIDVLEYFEYKDGLNVLEKCREHGKNIIISVPKDIGSQKDSFGNPFETHRFQWEKSHFNIFTDYYILPHRGRSLIVYMGENAKELCQIWKKKKSLLRRPIIRLLELLHLKHAIKRLLR